MSKKMDIITGKLKMTEQNALRYYIKQAERAKRSESITLMYEVYNMACGDLRIDICTGCPQDDVGYCYLRGTRAIDEHTKFCKYCFDGFIRNMKRELSYLQSKKKTRHV